jgi:hypothetical protein
LNPCAAFAMSPERAARASPSYECNLRGESEPCSMSRGPSVVHQAKTATAIRRSLRAAKAAQANGIAVDRVEDVLPDGSRLTIYPKRSDDAATSGELTPDDELKWWREKKNEGGS